MAKRAQKQPEQQAPPKQRLRMRYAKRGTARFTSHRDFARAFERALNRAHVPMAYSSGFSPHPRISYANASATGAASEAEYLEVALAEVCDPDKVRIVLGEQMPPGMEILEVVESDRIPFPQLLTASAWLIEPAHEVAGLAEAVRAVMAADTVDVERMTKSGMRTFDVRAALIGLDVSDGNMRLMLRHVTPLVRPDDVLRALGQTCPGLDAARVTRLAQGRCDEDASGVSTPLADPFTGAAVRVW
ncbi:TIGR03936 family radical SAM-associated protein [Cutibacterium sp.]|uniref:TIGR03936 family radical SAM-associated protein n=1 Tax=Cutibacterium sp. TaxID=1912221 RepID=UPI0026DC3F25|nr:TIGR03936 family radical SAM-associated protein [Cutibacterium sp.]MDO4411691.1 TIGR03936 family radical SAM-associated protein [Cutibacterium sp.]